MTFKDEQKKLENQKNLLKELAEKEIRKICSKIGMDFVCGMGVSAIKYTYKIEGFTYNESFHNKTDLKVDSLLNIGITVEQADKMSEIYDIYEYCVRNDIYLDFLTTNVEFYEIIEPKLIRNRNHKTFKDYVRRNIPLHFSSPLEIYHNDIFHLIKDIDLFTKRTQEITYEKIKEIIPKDINPRKELLCELIKDKNNNPFTVVNKFRNIYKMTPINAVKVINFIKSYSETDYIKRALKIDFETKEELFAKINIEKEEIEKFKPLSMNFKVTIRDKEIVLSYIDIVKELI